MIRQYPELFRIDLRHDFYAGRSGRELALKPTADTWRLMQQYDLRWGERPDGYLMVCGQEPGAAPRLSLLKGTTVLRFFLQCKHPYFLNITAIPFFHPDTHILYFDNLREGADTAEPLALAGKAGAAELLPLRGATFETEAAAGATPALRDAQNRILSTAADDDFRWKPLNMKERPNAFRTNLSELPPDKYGLDTGAGETAWFCYAGAEHRPGNLGLVNIYLGKETAGMVPIPDYALPFKAPGTAFHLSFGTRNTYRRYFVISRDDHSIDALEEDNSDKKNGNAETVADTSQPAPSPFFQIDPVDKPMPLRSGAQMAIRVQTKIPLPLQEKPAPAPGQKPPRLKFTKNENGNVNNKQIELPSPDWRIISHEWPSANDPAGATLPADWRSISPEGKETVLEVYSDMYIYL